MKRLIILAVSVLASPTPALADSTAQNAAVVIDADRLLIHLDSQLMPPARLSPGETREDVALVSFAFEQGYCGIGHLPDGIVKRVKEELSLLSNPKTDVTPNELCAALATTFSFVPDAHLTADIVGQGECQPLGGEKLAATHQVGANVAPNGSDSKKPVWRMRTIRTHGHDVTVMAITRFPPPRDLAWVGFDKALMTLFNADGVVIDLRQNSGGDSRQGLALASAILGRPVDVPVQTLEQLQTPAALALLSNRSRLVEIRGRIAGKPRDSGEEELRKKYDLLLERAKRGDLPRYSVEQRGNIEGGQKNVKTKKPVVILVDRDCGSSCELTVEALQGRPGILGVGQATAGAVHFREVGRVLLPHSHIVVNLGTKFVKYDDGRFIEKMGYKPDIELQNGQDALFEGLNRLF